LSGPALSIVIPSYNGRHLLEPCLASIERHRPADPTIEVIVVDDASTDGTYDWLGERYPGVRRVRREVNGGFVAAANAGIARACGEYIQVLNNDAEVTAGWVEAGLRQFRDPDVASVAPLVHFRDDPSRIDSAGDTYALVGWPSKRGHGRPTLDWAGRAPDRVFGASGSSAFYRAAALRQTGAFDPIYGSYYEDVDLAFRLRWAGYSCVFTPECRILHAVSASYDHGGHALQRRLSRNAEILFWSNLTRAWLVVGLVPHLAFLIAQAFARLAAGRLRPFLLGKLDALGLAWSILIRRADRRELAEQAPRRPEFPLRWLPLREARDHLRRPRPMPVSPHFGRRDRRATGPRVPKSRGIP
jgi:GT2 family glycosyltransferase